MKLNKYCEAKLSNIHGWGVFARRDIPKNKDIIEYKGEKISKKEGDKRSNKQEKKGAIYIFALNDKKDILDWGNRENPEWINGRLSL